MKSDSKNYGRVTIKNSTIGYGCTPFIVAEAGINHNGDIQKALEMISVAKKAGVDAVKFQTFKTKEVIEDSEITFTYKSQGNEVTESMFEMLKRHEFSREQWIKIK